MALIICPECGRQISDKAAMCIGCGIPMEEIQIILDKTSSTPFSANEKSLNSVVWSNNASNKKIKCISCRTEYLLSDGRCPCCYMPALRLTKEIIEHKGYSNSTDVQAIKKRKYYYRINGSLRDPYDIPFLMPIEDRFEIAGRGTVVTGRIERGILKTGDLVDIVGLNNTHNSIIVAGIESKRVIIDQAGPGQAVGVLLRGIRATEIGRGQVIAKPGTAHAYTRFKCQVYVLKKEEGGRSTPFFDGYRPQFYFRTTDVTGSIHLSANMEMCMPGDSSLMEIELVAPIALEEGQRFAVREGGRTVGSGVVTEIVQ